MCRDGIVGIAALDCCVITLNSGEAARAVTGYDIEVGDDRRGTDLVDTLLLLSN